MKTLLRKRAMCGRNGLAMMLSLIMLLGMSMLSSCSKSKSGDGSDLLKSVPSDAGMVIMADVNSLLEKTGSKPGDGGEVKLSSELSSAINAVKNPSLRDNMRAVLTGEAGVAHTNAILFTEGEDTYITFMIDDPDRFRSFAEKSTSEKFQSSGTVDVCGNIAMVGNQGWMRVANTAEINSADILKFSKLSESQSFLSRDIATKILESDKDVVAWVDIYAALNASGQNPMTRLVISSLFDDAAYYWGETSFDKGKVVSHGTVLNSKGETAKCNLPTSKIDVKTVQGLGEEVNADFIAAVAVSPALVKQLEKLAATFSGGIAAQYSSMLKPLDGTSAVAASDRQANGGLEMVVTVNDAPVGDLTTFLNTLGTVKREGKYLHVSTGEAKGNLKVADVAKEFSGCWLGFACDPNALSNQEGFNGVFTQLLLTFKPSDGGLALDVTLFTEGKANALVSLLEAAAK